MASAASSRAFAGGCSASAITAATVTGSHVLTINSYSESRGYRVSIYITSSKFIVAGRTWYLRYYPNGTNKETADYISFVLVHDGSTCVRAKFMFSLLDPEGGQVYSQKTSCLVAFHDSRTGWGFLSFIKREDFEKSKYLQNNCFRIVCDITVVNGFYKDATMKFVDTVPSSDLHQDLGWLLATGTGTSRKTLIGPRYFSPDCYPAGTNVQN
ncbi:unnamed protein product [Urochloa humidicola]